MKLELIRNATLKLTYGSRIFLTDPMLSPKDAMDPFAGLARNPTVELPCGMETITSDLDAVIVSHTHPDHYDQGASDSLPKNLPVFCQPGDDPRLTGDGFTTVIPVVNAHTWQGITLTRTGGRHGSDEILKRMGKVSGFVFEADGEPTVYWAGDTVWCDDVKEVLDRFSPDIIITHSGGATIPGFAPILMDAEQTLDLIAASPAKTIIIAVHMEALDHCTVKRSALRQLADARGVPSHRLLIPEDGESITL